MVLLPNSTTPFGLLTGSKSFITVNFKSFVTKSEILKTTISNSLTNTGSG